MSTNWLPKISVMIISCDSASSALQVIDKSVQFEKNLSGYAYFCVEVRVPLYIHLEEQNWRNAVNSARNATLEHQLSKGKDWSPPQQKTFRGFCGAELGPAAVSFRL